MRLLSLALTAFALALSSPSSSTRPLSPSLRCSYEASTGPRRVVVDDRTPSSARESFSEAVPLTIGGPPRSPVPSHLVFRTLSFEPLSPADSIAGPGRTTASSFGGSLASLTMLTSLLANVQSGVACKPESTGAASRASANGGNASSSGTGADDEMDVMDGCAMVRCVPPRPVVPGFLYGRMLVGMLVKRFIGVGRTQHPQQRSTGTQTLQDQGAPNAGERRTHGSGDDVGLESTSESASTSSSGSKSGSKSNSKSGTKSTPRAAKPRVLVIGAGAGILSLALRDRGFCVTSIDLDPMVLACAQIFFGLKASGHGPCFRVMVGDGRRFLEGLSQHVPGGKGHFDAIVLDAFVNSPGGAGETPHKLVTCQFVAAVRRALASNGMFVANVFTAMAPRMRTTWGLSFSRVRWVSVSSAQGLLVGDAGGGDYLNDEDENSDGDGDGDGGGGGGDTVGAVATAGEKWDAEKMPSGERWGRRNEDALPGGNAGGVGGGAGDPSSARASSASGGDWSNPAAGTGTGFVELRLSGRQRRRQRRPLRGVVSSRAPFTDVGKLCSTDTASSASVQDGVYGEEGDDGNDNNELT